MRIFWIMAMGVVVCIGAPMYLEIGGESPISNSIGDIVYYDGNVYVSTIRGLSLSRDMGESFENTLEGFGFSGLTAGYGKVLAASSRDTVLQGDSYPLGSGLYISDHEIFDWVYRDDPAFTFISDPVNPGNIAYDVEIVRQGIDTVIWVPSFYGGLVRSSDMGASWKQVVPDGVSFDPNGRIGHRHFAFCADVVGMEPYEYNAVIEIAGSGMEKYVGTRKGLFRQAIAGGQWNIEIDGAGFPSILIHGGEVFAQAIMDSAVGDVLIAVGGGLWVSDTGSGDWEEIESDFFRGEGFYVQDFEVIDDVIWAACFYGGLIRSSDNGRSWEQIFPDGSTEHDPYGNPDHRFFAVHDNSDGLWVGTGEGIYLSEDHGNSWSAGNDIGWVIEINSNDGMSFAVVRGEETGDVFYTVDSGTSWQELGREAQYVDIGFAGDYIYASSEHGIERASLDDLENWTLLDLTDAETGLEHKGNEVFDLYSIGDTLYAGTQRGLIRSKNYGDNFNIDTEPCDFHIDWPVLYDGSGAGVNISTDGGKTWENDGFDTLNGLTGEWVVGLEVQNLGGESVVWAVTKRALDADEENGFSYTTDNGNTWHWTAIDAYGWNFAFDDSVVYAATSGGLMRATYPELLWDTLEIHDEITGISLTDPEIVGVQSAEGRLFAGTNQGLAISDDRGETWRIKSTYPAADVDGEEEVYAYPSPFSPYIDGSCFIVYPAEIGSPVTVTIHDFALDEVVTVVEDFIPQHDDEDRIQWDGRDRNGNLPANGVYFISVDNGDEILWGKVMLIK